MNPTALLQIGGLNCFYFALLGAGVTYALVILVAGELGDFGSGLDLAGPGDVLHGSVNIAHVSPITVAGFVTAFGAFGLIGTGLAGASAGESLIWASVGGLAVGVVSHLAFIYIFLKPQGSSEVTRADLVGVKGEIITPAPAGRVGEIAVVAQGARFTMTAREIRGAPLERGGVVKVVEIVGSVALVEPWPPAAQD